MLAACQDQRERMLILIGLYFGTRISETLSLKFEDFDGEYLTVKRAKGSNNSTVKIPSHFRPELDKMRKFCHKKNGWIFESRKGTSPITPRSGNRILHEIVGRAGLTGKINAHSFRKSYTNAIYQMCERDLVETAKYTGHKSINSLIYYIETTREQNLTAQLSWA